MLAIILAASISAPVALAAGSTAGSAAVNVLESPTDLPHFIEKPSAEQFSAAYPRAAAQNGIGGHVVLHCQVQARGNLGGCRALSEAPAAMGFAEAAISISHLFRIDPRDPAARQGDLDIPIEFVTANADGDVVPGGPWTAAPTFAEIALVYPDIGGGVTGQVIMHCNSRPDGQLGGCKVVEEHPSDRDFGPAALKLAHAFRLQIEGNHKVPPSAGANVILRLSCPGKPDFDHRTILSPHWVTRINPAAILALFPSAAAAKGLSEGVGNAQCEVAANGSLKDCHAVTGDPDGVGFSEAATKVVSGMRMSPWTDAGNPVDGALVRIPVRFEKAAGSK